MTDLLEFALTKLRGLPPERQDQAARAILDVAEGVEENAYELSDDEKAAIEAGRAEIERGEVVSEDEVQAVLVKYRL